MDSNTFWSIAIITWGLYEGWKRWLEYKENNRG